MKIEKGKHYVYGWNKFLEEGYIVCCVSDNDGYKFFTKKKPSGWISNLFSDNFNFFKISEFDNFLKRKCGQKEFYFYEINYKIYKALYE